ncbi:MAG: 3-deoxy-D-manno-octulosonic acid transferase [Proteobacteria bacterium]|nr:3-deoxy-D-manno-octulosonic acid transferase [Desulfobacteraceae bacterium]MBU3981716.1 3-deoxy-D-manno-octulosonic acid transferase [Pseudomonadota bacterium]MBU4012160.1 3-deoxy-D-manno-octulosonic acid transferase [Pseudomonadota bacterium]MBU4067472.1 3-deoxy-D-manno-octulosonic acid transferase [Pseudomonadota bacterium]
MITLYNIILTIGITVGIPLIIPIILLSEKRRKTFLQRLGLKQLPENILSKSAKKPIWIHALSVGEVLSSVPLVMNLKGHFKDKRIVFSASTKTGFEIADKLFKKNVDSIFFFPFDLLFSVKYITKKIDPAIVIIVESDIWPNFLFEMKKRNVPVILINARLSKRSFKRYRRFAFIANKLFLSFAKICTQSIEDTKRFMLLGIPSNMISTTGNIKFDQPYDSVSEKEIEILKQSMNIRLVKKILMAGSTHEGEESILIDAFSRIRKNFADTVLIIVPRDPERAGSILKLCKSSGFSSILMKDFKNTDKNEKFDVIVVDVIGILKRLYAIADVAFVGGSLVNLSGHNPLEPAAFSKPVIFGQYMSDFAYISQMLLDSGGAAQVKNTNSLYETIVEILSDSDKARNMGEKAFKVFNANKGAVEKTLKVIESQLKA